MMTTIFTSIDPEATGRNIRRLRVARGYSVNDIREAVGFEAPQAVYKWQTGQTLPSLDNMLILSDLFGVTINEIIVRRGQSALHAAEEQPKGCSSVLSAA